MVPGGFIPEEDMGYFYVNVQLPNAASIQRSDVVTKDIEQILMQIPEIDFVTTATGYSILSGAMVSNTGFLWVTLKDWSERERTAEEIIRDVNIRLAMAIKKAQVFAFGPSCHTGSWKWFRI